MGFASYLYRQVFVHPPQLPPDLNLAGQTVMITGANSGIGLEAARQCVRLNASRLILAVRTLSKGDEAKKDILRASPLSKTTVDIWQLDMESFESVLAFGQRTKSLARLDVAMLNAGNFKFEWSVSTSTGFESQLQVNHLSSALLSLLLIPVLRKTSCEIKSPPRLTFTASEVHMWTPFKEKEAENILERLNMEEFYGDEMDRYSVTKLLNVFWVRELARRIRCEEVVINYFNPGSVDSGLHRDGGKMIRIFDHVIGRTREEGGRLLMDAATVKGFTTHGQYLSEARLIKYIRLPMANSRAEQTALTLKTRCSAFVRGEDGNKIQEKLWSETMNTLRNVVSSDVLDDCCDVISAT